MSRPFPCAYEVYPGDYLNPPEYCPNDVDTPFSDVFCGDHLPYEALSPEDYEGDHE